jgi:DNA-binding NarL/FixJ family response regulator
MPSESQAAAPQKRVERAGATKHEIDCVFLTCFDSDFYFLANVFPCSEIRMHRAETLEQADFLLIVTGGTVLLTDVSFLDGFWGDAVDMLAQFHPLVAFLVIADGVDRQFVSEAPRRGACGVLWKPLDWSQVRRFIRLLHEATEERAIWQRQRLRSDRIEEAVSPGVTLT